MTCVLIDGNSRRCEDNFKLLPKDVSMEFCHSDDYSLCPIYKIIIEKTPYCEYIEECGYRLHRLNSSIRHDTNIYKNIMHLIFDYCISENSYKCERKKLKENGAFVPNALLQDGSFLKSIDFLEEVIH